MRDETAQYTHIKRTHTHIHTRIVICLGSTTSVAFAAAAVAAAAAKDKGIFRHLRTLNVLAHKSRCFTYYTLKIAAGVCESVHLKPIHKGHVERVRRAHVCE